jgi:hypothetical protein
VAEVRVKRPAALKDPRVLRMLREHSRQSRLQIRYYSSAE